MGTKTGEPILTNTPDLRLIIGSFEFTAGATDAPTAVYGKGFTVTKAAAGSYLVTLSRKYPKMIAVVATIQLPTGGAGLDQVAIAGVITAATATANNKVQILVRDISGNALGDATADANARINFIITVSENSHTYSY